MAQDDPAFHTALLPTLYNEYQQIMGAMFNPDNDKALTLLTDMRDRIERAMSLISGLPVERVEYRNALDKIICLEEGEAFDIAYQVPS